MSADLHAVVDAYLTHKRGVGRKFDSEQAELTLLARFVDRRGVNRLDQLSAGVIDDFLASPAADAAPKLQPSARRRHQPAQLGSDAGDARRRPSAADPQASRDG